jgi:hypothetical protein
MVGPGAVGEMPVDVVYTWVDDQWPGYANLLAQHAQEPVDLDPSRTRDNLELLRFSFRSLERFAPWVRKIYLLTCRPQVPGWLNPNHPQIRIVHHDEIIPGSILPTFNSLAIVSYLHLIPGLSDNFVYLEDDMLLRAPLHPESLCTGDGKLKVFRWHLRAPRWQDIASPDTERPWNLALAESNRLLDSQFGESLRRQLCHMPRLINKRQWERMMEMFDEAIAATRKSRFRQSGNVAPEFIYPWMMLAENSAALAPESEAKSRSGYVPLENVWPITLWAMLQARWRQAEWLTFNDNLPARPSVVTEALVRWQLQSWFPEPSRFER